MVELIHCPNELPIKKIDSGGLNTAMNLSNLNPFFLLVKNDDGRYAEDEDNPPIDITISELELPHAMLKVHTL